MLDLQRYSVSRKHQEKGSGAAPEDILLEAVAECF